MVLVTTRRLSAARHDARGATHHVHQSPPGFRRAICEPQRPRGFLSLSHRTLEKHRCYGTGPRYCEGRRPRRLPRSTTFRRGSIVGVKSSTSDPGIDTVLPAKRHAAIAPAYVAGNR